MEFDKIFEKDERLTDRHGLKDISISAYMI